MTKVWESENNYDHTKKKTICKKTPFDDLYSAIPMSSESSWWNNWFVFMNPLPEVIQKSFFRDKQTPQKATLTKDRSWTIYLSMFYKQWSNQGVVYKVTQSKQWYKVWSYDSRSPETQYLHLWPLYPDWLSPQTIFQTIQMLIDTKLEKKQKVDHALLALRDQIAK